MEEYAVLEPVYGFERHKGYPTFQGSTARVVLFVGPSRIQRLSFRVTAP